MCMKNKNIEAQAKFPGSYIKKSVSHKVYRSPNRSNKVDIFDVDL